MLIQPFQNESSSIYNKATHTEMNEAPEPVSLLFMLDMLNMLLFPSRDSVFGIELFIVEKCRNKCKSESKVCLSRYTGSLYFLADADSALCCVSLTGTLHYLSATRSISSAHVCHVIQQLPSSHSMIVAVKVLDQTDGTALYAA